MAEDALKAFTEHDFDADEAWCAYLKRVEIPTNSAADLLKVKAKWWRRERDPDFDVAAAIGAAAPAAPPLPTSTPPQQQQQQQQPAQARPAQAQARPAAWGGAAGLSSVRELLVPAANLGVIVLSFLHIVPIVSFDTSLRAYKGALLCCTLSSILQLFKENPAPMADVRAWMARTQLSLSFNMAITPLVLFSTASLTALLLPYCVAAAYRLLAYGSAHHAAHPLWRSHGERAYNYLLAHRQRALGFNAQMDISLGFYLLYRLFTPSRSFIAAFYVWQQLRTRYWLTESGPYHRAAWAGLDAATKWVRDTAPPLERPIALARRWFAINPMAAAAATARR
ncbi:hypothetical protein Rsub_12304 [Raphidocelis subcapitata]|uniref:Uncharacterized protein n=1 Tax=Raphidocelis subcapitata TaxID=307507 RepID=A0A2V0PQW5_9CHLO|nr:hypothetical protein Rsub_12304 [Raphidocelis subcapitata]|eukprot:GBF99625.1 hypothetical protein Rsub_12304 [Raphidocelis subcapitata]